MASRRRQGRFDVDAAAAGSGGVGCGTGCGCDGCAAGGRRLKGKGCAGGSLAFPTCRLCRWWG